MSRGTKFDTFEINNKNFTILTIQIKEKGVLGTRALVSTGARGAAAPVNLGTSVLAPVNFQT